MKRHLHSAFIIALTVAIACSSAVSQSNPAKNKFVILHSFVGGSDGQTPAGGLIMDAAGDLYGTTALGGGPHGQSDCCGSVYKIDPSGNLTILYGFVGGRDGKYPTDNLLLDSAGNLFGTTSGGGTSGSACNGYGCGTVFVLHPDGTEQVLYNFTGGVDGATPYAGLTLGTDGRFYGTTYLGGAYNWGTVYAVDTNGVESVIHDFNGAAPDGGDIQAGLISDGAGSLYGLAFGGDNPYCLPNFQLGCGVIYKVTETGEETVLFAFDGKTNGFWPGGNLTRDSAGNLYGTNQGMGKGYPSRYGTIFKLDPAGNLTILHRFTGGKGGVDDWGGVVRDASGNLYGTTLNGGEGTCYDGCGTVFVLDSLGRFRILHEFTGGADGGFPSATLLLDAAGNLYGTAQQRGLGDGVVFKIVRH